MAVMSSLHIVCNEVFDLVVGYNVPQSDLDTYLDALEDVEVLAVYSYFDDIKHGLRDYYRFRIFTSINDQCERRKIEKKNLW